LGSDQEDFAALREAMVRRHLLARGITEPKVIEAFRRVPREAFVPESARAGAYDDHPLAIGYGQTISQPYMVALMTQELRVDPGSRVLEIGTGSGYQTAILAELGAQVYTVERIEALSQRAQQALARLGFPAVRWRVGDGTLGWPEEAPFDRIIVTAGAPRMPRSLVDQLAEEGRMVIPVGGVSHQDLLVATRTRGQVSEHAVCGCVFVRLVGKEGWRSETDGGFDLF